MTAWPWAERASPLRDLTTPRHRRDERKAYSVVASPPVASLPVATAEVVAPKASPSGSKVWPRLTLALACVAIAVSWTIALRTHVIGLNGDEAAHLLHARRVTDSVSPGFGQIGQYWLPFYQLIEIPFTSVGYLYRTGLAGTIPSGLCYLAAVLGAYNLGLEITRDRAAGALAALSVGANPNLLYLGSIPMMETSIIATLMWATATLVRANRTLSFKDLMIAGSLAGVASFATYGAWGLAIYGPAVLIVTARSRNMSWRQTRFIATVYGAAAIYPALLWMAWCLYIQHDALYFIHVAAKGGANTLPGALAGHPRNLLFAIVNYFCTVLDVFGPVATIVIVGVLVVAAVRRKFLAASGAGLAAAALSVLTLTNNGALGSPTYAALAHLQHVPLATYINVRYGSWIAPFLAAAVALAAGKSRRRQLAMAALLLVGLSWFAIPKMEEVAIPPGNQRAAPLRNEALGAEMRKYYDGGKVLTFSPGSGDTIIWQSGLPSATFITQFNPEQFTPAFRHPLGHVRFVFIEPDAPLNLSPLRDLLQKENFQLIYSLRTSKNGQYGYELWKAP
jgi:hypothetical protein